MDVVETCEWDVYWKHRRPGVSCDFVPCANLACTGPGVDIPSHAIPDVISGDDCQSCLAEWVTEFMNR